MLQARPLLKSDHAIRELVDPRLRSSYVEHEIYDMLQCPFLCIRRDPHTRPRMSQVLRMLEWTSSQICLSMLELLGAVKRIRRATEAIKLNISVMILAENISSYTMYKE
ncbi:hypothetical protein HRI_003449100 [Hibiscus trionum]|uniref:non-specific serine/threonine protein kinase n=1 Tax=Hibiscus trionum TaxID=183268 RepID=A0A9W7IM69_HIBTR|nr:hypothetical protein HRI_003449100 [Hibiscus trionum]